MSDIRDLRSSGARFGIVRSVSYGLFGPPDEFVPQLRSLGAGLVRVYFYWSQIEPEPGSYRFEAVDAFLGQLDGSEEVWITVCSSSPWATKVPATFLPPSAANDSKTYYRFVYELVRHCGGRVRLWQCENEPSNVGLTWSGTADEYVAQLKVLHRAVKDADADALVVLGGATYGLPAAPSDSPERRFFDTVLRDGRDHFDLFDVHLYQEAERIPTDVETIRSMMRTFDYEKPIVAGEYNAPWPNLFSEAAAAVNEAMVAVFSEPEAEAGPADPGAPAPTPEQRAMARLYDRMADLPPQLQMFMQGCPPELAARRDRINCREIAMRNVLALSAGIRRTVCWNLAPDVPGYEDHLSAMDLLFGKLALMRYAGRSLTIRQPAADAFARVVVALDGAVESERLAVAGRPNLRVFDVRRAGRSPLLVAWVARESFSGEDEPPEFLDWPWSSEAAAAVDALGEFSTLHVEGGRVTLPLSVTPIFVEPGPA